MAFHDPYTPARDDLPGWVDPPQVSRPRPRPARFLADMFSGVVIVASLASLWIAVALIVDAAKGGM